MIFLYALLQSPVIPPKPQDPHAEPLARVQSPEGLPQYFAFEGDIPDSVHDFLGRRRICADIATDPEPEAEERRRFLNCATLQIEEVEMRRRFAADRAVVWLLSRPATDYQIARFLSRFDGESPNVRLRRITQEGVEPESGKRVVVSIETLSGPTSLIRITASWGDMEARTVQVNASDLPGFDSSTTSLWLRSSGEHEGLSITASFGRHRGYCWNGTEDDRPEVNFFFTRTGVSASRQGWPDCNPSHETLTIELVPGGQGR